MPAEITFSGGEKLTVADLSGSELVGRLSKAESSDKSHFIGDYLNVLHEGHNIWINPAQVAYVRDA